MNIKVRKIFIMSTTVLFLAGCWWDSGKVELNEEGIIVGKVNEKELTLARVKMELAQVKKKFRLESNDSIKPDELLWMKNQAINQVVQEELLLQEAKKQGVDVTEEEFQVALQKMKSGYQEEQFLRTLEIEEINENEWNNRFRANLIIKKLIRRVVDSNININEEEMLKYFDGHREEFNKAPQIRARHIMVEKESDARDVLKKLENNPELFGFLAQKSSLGFEAPNGGDLGYMEAGQMPEVFDVIFDLKIDEVSDIIQTPYGFHIFMVIGRIPERQMSFKEARTIIKNKLIQENKDLAFSRWLNLIRQEALIEVDYKVLNAIS